MMECAMTQQKRDSSKSKDEIVVFIVRGEAQCAECGEELHGGLLRK
jgi:hypothetical protein